jgi:hypothetical protein
MRRRVLLVLTLVAMGGAACATGARWERAGATEADRRRDEAECAGQANRDRSVPVSRGAAGTSTRRGMDGIELATIRDFDTGAFDQCMAGRGYQLVPGRPSG